MNGLALPVLGVIVSFLDATSHLVCAVVSRHVRKACQQRISWFPVRTLRDLSESGSRLTLQTLADQFAGTVTSHCFTDPSTLSAKDAWLQLLLEQLGSPSLTELGWAHHRSFHSHSLDWLTCHSPTLVRVVLNGVALSDAQWDTLVCVTSNLTELRVLLSDMPRLCLLGLHNRSTCKVWPQLSRLRLDVVMTESHMTCAFLTKYCEPLLSLLAELDFVTWPGNTNQATCASFVRLIKMCPRLEICRSVPMRALSRLLMGSDSRVSLETVEELGVDIGDISAMESIRCRALMQLPRLQTLRLACGPWPAYAFPNQGSSWQLSKLEFLRVTDLRPEDFTDASRGGVFSMRKLRVLSVLSCSWGASWSFSVLEPQEESSVRAICSGRVSAECYAHGRCRRVFVKQCPENLLVRVL
jgi:hypothetical protein